MTGARGRRGRRNRGDATRRLGEPCVGLALGAALAAAALLCLPAAAQALEQKLTASDGAAGDQLGQSVAIDGDTAVVGTPLADNVSGAVYVFQRVGDRWAQTAKLTASDSAAGDGLGRSVAIDGETIVAGAPGDDAFQGSVYTFARTGGDRTETAKLAAFTGAAGETLGISVAIDGGTIVAGAPDDPAGSGGPGSVYTFARTGPPQRNEIAQLTAANGDAGDGLGISVAIDGDRIVAGAPLDDAGMNPNANQGAAYTFVPTGMDETHTAKLTATNAAANTGLGASVAIDGDTIVAGAFGDDATRGSAYTFARTGGQQRNETAKLTASDGATGDVIGFSVAIDGDTIVAGAPSLFGGTAPGSAYTFARSGPAARTETAKLTASDGAAGDGLGASVAIDGDTLVAGAPVDDVGANADQGSASIFFPPAPRPPGGGGGGGGGGATSGPATVPCPEGTSPTVVCTRDAQGRLHYQGTDAAETFAGTKGDEVMVGEGGRDRMKGKAGDDKMKGGAGKDKLKGDGGRDKLSGQRGRDKLKGGGGKDKLHGGKGKDKLKGQGGRDKLKGNSGGDRFSGGGGNDRINAKGQKSEKVGCGGGRKDRVKNAKGDRVKPSCERVRR